MFKERFGIRTPIKYTWDVVVEPKNRAAFNRAWRKFYAETEPTGSKRQRARFEAFLNRLERYQDDLLFCEKVEIRYISETVGYGVFAREDIPKDEILNHYAGVLRPDSQIASDNDSTFAVEDFTRFSIDAQSEGNWVRFMNHAPDDEANVVAWEHYSERGPRIIFVAGKKGIKEGEQLLYSYGEDYWVDRSPQNL